MTKVLIPIDEYLAYELEVLSKERFKDLNDCITHLYLHFNEAHCTFRRNKPREKSYDI